MLADVTNKNVDLLDKFEFPEHCVRHTLKIFLIYLQFKWNRASCILSDNPTVVGTELVDYIIKSCRQIPPEIEK